MKHTLALTAVVALIPLVAGQASVYGQCGGIGWSGATTCASGSVCTYSNDYYSQCLPGTGGGGSPTTAKPTTTATQPAPTAGSSTLPWLGGVNMAGYDFAVAIDGSFKSNPQDPPASQFSHFASEGVNIFRVPFAWQLMTPTLGGNIDQTFFQRYDNTVQTGRRTGAYVIIDLHNYARWNGQVIGQGGPTNAQYNSIWTQLANKYKGDSEIIFGIMNEPHDLPNLSSWVATVQGVVNAIRATGATNYILIPGSTFSSAAALPNEAGPGLLGVTDNGSSNKSKLIFDVHRYLDSDNSGTHTECVTNNVDVFTTLYNWLKTNNRQALVSETGGGNTDSCVQDVGQELAFLKAHQDRFVGFTMWSAGAFDSTYELTLTPNGNTDTKLWQNAVRPYLP